MTKVLVTGATGFVGRAILSELTNSPGLDAFGTTRHLTAGNSDGTRMVQVGDLVEDTDWTDVLAGVDVIVHAAARVHVMNDKSDDALAAFRAANVEGTARLAKQAAAAGVRRFVFLSSIKANGEETAPGEAFTATSKPAPVDPYGLSKLEAEGRLFEFGKNTGIDVVVIRSPLVYGPGVGANFRAMMAIVNCGIPLPFAAVHNKRSLIYLRNLVDFVRQCVVSEEAPGHVFLVSDGSDLSTPELLSAIATGLGRNARLFPMPELMLRVLGRMTGRSNAIARLVGSLQVNIETSCETLGWKPPFQATAGIMETARVFREQQDERRGEL